MNVTVDAAAASSTPSSCARPGRRVLDRYAIAIVDAAAPFGEFTAAMRRKADELVITSRFRFTRDESLQTTSLPRHEPNPPPDGLQPIDRYAVLGNPVPHSQSPAIHAAFAQATRQVAALRAAALSARRLSRVRCTTSRARRPTPTAVGPARGCNVTMPFKFQAFELAARHSERARLAQAANTLRFDADGWLADNTDGAGLVRDIEVNAGVEIGGARCS